MKNLVAVTATLLALTMAGCGYHVAGTATLLAVLVVNDFLRTISGAGALPPFWDWVIFFLSFGLAQAVQSMRNPVRDDA